MSTGQVIHLESVDSTNEYLKRRGALLPDGMVVVADHQTAGKGRLGRSWQDAPGQSLLASWLLKSLQGDALLLLPLAAGMAVLDALDSLGAQGAALKVGVGKAAALLLAAGVLLSNAPRSLGEDGIDVVKLQRVFPRPLERQIIQRTALDGVAGKFAQRLDGVEGVGIDVAVAAGGLRLLEIAQSRGQFLRFPDLA